MSGEEIKNLVQRLRTEAEEAGYYLNPDESMVFTLVEGLVKNENRYGYWACPCMEAEGNRDDDLDIICPCDYRDEDLNEYGTCYCALYVSEEVATGKKEIKPIPERRAIMREEVSNSMTRKEPDAQKKEVFGAKEVPVWRCRVCGYLCARPEAPLKCPICKADQDRFEPFP